MQWMGWNHALRDFLSLHWCCLPEQDVVCPDKEHVDIGESRMVHILMCLWKYAWSTWLQRNNLLHRKKQIKLAKICHDQTLHDTLASTPPNQHTSLGMGSFVNNITITHKQTKVAVLCQTSQSNISHKRQQQTIGTHSTSLKSSTMKDTMKPNPQTHQAPMTIQPPTPLLLHHPITTY